METFLKIKWENIISLLILITSIFGWITFIKVPDVYTLALAILPTIMSLVLVNLYDAIKECRKETLKLWQ